MSFLGKLFGSEKAIESASNAIDKMVFTDEEKSDMKIELLKAYAPFKLAQRYFMLVVTVPYMLIWLSTGLSILFYDARAGEFTDIKDFIMNGDVIYLVLTMAAFYFGDTIAGKFKK